MERQQGSEPSDREQRAELEQLQTGLRDARAALARGGDPRPEQVEKLEAELTELTALADAARAEVTRLEAELAEHEQIIRTMQREIEEEKVQKLGRSRRDKYVDWAPPNTVRPIEPSSNYDIGYDGSNPSVIIVPLVVFGLALLFGFLWLAHH